MLRYWVFWFVFRVLGRLPLGVIYRIADFASWAGFHLAKGTREAVLDNMRHVLGPDASERKVKQAGREVFRTVAYYYADTAYMPRLDTKEFLEKRLNLIDLEKYLRPALDAGNGVAMITAHFGNPELVMQGLTPLGIPIIALTEPLDPPALSKLMDAQRSSLGITFVPVSVGNVKKVLQTLKRGGAAALMGDRDIEGPRERLPFFGVEASVPTGPIELALRTGATVIPCFAIRRGRYKFDAVVEPPLELVRTGDLQHDVRTGQLEWLARFERRLRGQSRAVGRVRGRVGRGRRRLNTRARRARRSFLGFLAWVRLIFTSTLPRAMAWPRRGRCSTTSRSTRTSTSSRSRTTTTFAGR